MDVSYLVDVIPCELHKVTDSVVKAVLVSEEWDLKYQMLHGIHHADAA